MELLSLKWNNHKTTFFHVLKNVRAKEAYTDVTLACEGQFFPVHRLVLATCSDYFAEVFEKATCKAPLVIINGIQLKNLKYLLDYMYLGEVDVPQAELASLIKAAEQLQIKGLAVPDEDPSASNNKRSHDSEPTSQPKRPRTENSEKENTVSPREESESHSKRRISRSDRGSTPIIPVDTIKLEPEETQPNTQLIPKQEQSSSQTDLSKVKTFETEEFGFQEDSNSRELYEQEDDTTFDDTSADLAWEDEPSQSAQPGENMTPQAKTYMGLWRAYRRQMGSSAKMCPFCGKSFHAPFHLKTHIRIHTGERPYKCPICSKGFTQQGNMRKHLLTHPEYHQGSSRTNGK